MLTVQAGDVCSDQRTENHVHISNIIQRFIYIYKYDDDASYRESCTYIKNDSEIYIYDASYRE